MYAHRMEEYPVCSLGAVQCKLTNSSPASASSVIPSSVEVARLTRLVNVIECGESTG